MKLQITIFIILSTFIRVFAQDTLQGDYSSLHILKGKHIIKSVINVNDELVIDEGATIEFLSPGTIVCNGKVEINGKDHNIEFYGSKNREGVGFIFNNANDKSIFIKNAVFRNLQLPLFFDFGWKRNLVEINDNIFTHNLGRVSVIQVLNPPFSYSIDSSYIQFNLLNNLFTDNNASIYFEDLKSDQLNANISNNIFANNFIYGSKNYNIATNMIYGRVDQSNTRYSAILKNNSFVSNNLMDIITDTIVQAANFGIYGTDKNFSAKGNFWGSTNKEAIYTAIYDQSKNYSLPRVDVDPILRSPGKDLSTHIYEVSDAKNPLITIDNIASKLNTINSFILKSNNQLDFTNSTLIYHYLKNDTSTSELEKTIKFSVVKDNINTSHLNLRDSSEYSNPNGYLLFSNLKDLNNKVVPDVKIGYKKYLYAYWVRKLIQDSLLNLRVKDATAKVDSNADEIIKYNEPPFRKSLEYGLGIGGVIFRGTVGTDNLFNSEVNLHNSLIVNYNFKPKLTATLKLSYFVLSANDFNSPNADQIARGYFFQTPMFSISPSINYTFAEANLIKKSKKKFTNSIGTGIEYSFFNPTSTYMGVTYDLQKLGTGGQFNDSVAKPYSLKTFGLFFSYRIKFDIAKNINLSFIAEYHKSFTDYLDDVGADKYPDPNVLLSKKGAPAVYFSNPTSDYISTGRLRNFPTSPSDNYLNFGISITKRLLF